MTPATKLSKSDGVPFDDPTLYRSTIGALQYLTLTRPDIAFSVNKLSQFLTSPSLVHWNACKHLLRYLKGITHLKLQFQPSSSSMIEGYSDAEWESCPDDRRSTGGHCIFLGSNLVTWSAKKQEVVSCSNAESEYRSMANATTDIVWLKSLCAELSLSLHSPHRLWCDNASALALANNPVFHARTKHIEVDVHYIQEKISDNTIEVGHVPSSDQIVDVFTKPLAEPRFCLLRDRLNLVGSG
ncbi:secreted RxLR effector protein 161-like [Salvia miltiorrhiza]|uniref:secreted RxLR effector protein 161-like n=1 Tax=Salvia miltiorrhiza TaxID=226208 RepID=UPI0025ACA370|nr:secreted RxLR effector protein 161-like [Salvia miltiorrhiza]